MKLCRYLVLLIIALFATPQVTEARRPVVAVFAMKNAAKLKRQDVAQLTELLAAMLTATGKYAVVPSADLKRALQQKKSESYKTCYDESCQIEIGKEVAAEKTLSTAVRRIGSSCIVTMELFDLRQGTSQAAATKRGGCSIDEVLDSVDAAIKDLVKSEPAQFSSTSKNLAASSQTCIQLCKKAKSCDQNVGRNECIHRCRDKESAKAQQEFTKRRSCANRKACSDYLQCVNIRTAESASSSSEEDKYTLSQDEDWCQSTKVGKNTTLTCMFRSKASCMRTINNYPAASRKTIGCKQRPEKLHCYFWSVKNGDGSSFPICLANDTECESSRKVMSATMDTRACRAYEQAIPEAVDTGVSDKVCQSACARIGECKLMSESACMMGCRFSPSMAKSLYTKYEQCRNNTNNCSAFASCVSKHDAKIFREAKACMLMQSAGTHGVNCLFADMKECQTDQAVMSKKVKVLNMKCIDRPNPLWCHTYHTPGIPNRVIRSCSLDRADCEKMVKQLALAKHFAAGITDCRNHYSSGP